MKEAPLPNTVFSPGWAGFTSDWFSHRIPAWRKHLLPIYQTRETHWLEIGSHEGRSAIWTMDNVLKHPRSHITCVDPWMKDEFEGRFDSNIAAAMEHLRRSQGFVVKRKGFSDRVMRTMDYATVDVAYIDGDHQGKSALADAVHAWPLIKTGGHLIFDDYKWNFSTEAERKAKLPARHGIDAFLKLWASELKVVHHDYQVIIQKV
jgi:predicted O-methyltransferase YrrM